jgi:WS/DGAT/MGAT family acyltransferase
MRMTQHDASFLYGETASGPMSMTSFAVIEGELTFAQVRDHIASRIHMAHRLRQRLVFVPFNLAHPKWVDDPDFSIDKHIFELPVASGFSLEQAIERGIEVAEALLPRDQPLWRMDIIVGVPQRTIIMQRAHHAMLDGASAVELSLLLFDLQKKPAEFPPEKTPWNPPPLPSAAALVAEAMQENARQLLNGKFPDLRGEHGELLRRAGETLSKFISEPAMTAPWNAGLVGPKRLFRTHSASFSDLRTIRRAFGGTLNDVVLTAFIEGAARYLEEKGERTQDARLRVMCPVNVRHEDDKGAMGNRVSAIFPMFEAATLGVLERLKRVRWETERLKQNRDAQAMSLMMESAPQIPPLAMAPTLLVGTQFDPTRVAARFPLPVAPQFAPRLPNFGFNFTLTNVPGVQTPQYLAGHEVLDLFGMMMLGGNLGYGVAIYTYNQRVIFNFTAEARLMPDLERMRDHVVAVYEELLALAQAEVFAQAAG